MHCERSREAIIIREFETLEPSISAALSRHMKDCRSCRLFQAQEEALSRDLAHLGAIAPTPAQVTSRIMSEIEKIGVLSRDLVPDRQLALASLAAVLSAMAVLFGGIRMLPQLAEAAPHIKLLLASLATTAMAFVSPLEAAMTVLSVITRTLIGLLLPLSPVLIRMFPLAIYITAVLFAIAAITSTIVAARDLVTPRNRKES